MEGFTKGFALKFKGSRTGQHQAKNLKLRIGNKQILWNKIMKEVEAKRYLGPFKKDDPIFTEKFDYFYQNPIGLVPKGEAKEMLDDEGNSIKGANPEIWNNPKNCRLIFHLSYKFDGVGSVNGGTERDDCTVEYEGIDQAVERAAKFKTPFGAKTDGVSAFSQIPVRKEDWNLMVMKAECPDDGQEYYFASKVLGFGHSISCRLFTEFMTAVVHVVGQKSQHGPPIFYLDDTICIDGNEEDTNQHLKDFMDVCNQINYPLSPEKTIWASQVIVFLGMLLDFINRILCIPLEKKNKAVRQIREILRKKKIKMHKLQRLTGLLNFLGRAIVPGRAFTRRLYHKTARLEQHHHLRVDRDIQEDLNLWLTFLESGNLALFRPFMDFSTTLQVEEISWYSDASLRHGWGCTYDKFWACEAWTDQEKELVDRGVCNIQMQELFAFCVAVKLFAPMLQNKRVVTHCDNQAVVAMINKSSSSCKVCMEMIRVITMESMKFNCRFFSKWVETKKNGIADALSRGDMARFRSLAPNKSLNPLKPPRDVWPMKLEWWNH